MFLFSIIKTSFWVLFYLDLDFVSVSRKLSRDITDISCSYFSTRDLYIVQHVSIHEVTAASPKRTPCPKHFLLISSVGGSQSGSIENKPRLNGPIELWPNQNCAILTFSRSNKPNDILVYILLTFVSSIG